MGLVPFSPWVCLRCGLVTRHALFAPDCCDDQFAIQVRVEIPGRGVEHDLAAIAATEEED